MSSRSSILVVLSLVIGCGDSAATDDSIGEEETTTTNTTTTADSTAADSDTGASGSDDGAVDTGFDPPEPECGNGFVEPGEQCDDGNDIDDDDCNNDCLIPCGVEWEVTELPPTGESPITGLRVVRDAQDAIVTAGSLREVTTDQEGGATAGPREVLLVRHDAAGTKLWDSRISLGDGDTRVGGLAVDSNGDIYLALTVDGDEGGSDIVVSKRAAGDGAELWQHVYDSEIDTSVDLATGIAVTSEGDVVASGTVRAGVMDDDVWVRRIGGALGDEMWTTTWSGPGDGMFSVDRGGPVVVGPSGAAYVLVREHVAQSIAPVFVLRVQPDGGDDPQAEPWFTPQHPGDAQVFTAVGLDVDSEENVVFALERMSFFGIEFWVHKVDSTGSQVWQRERDEFEVREGSLRIADVTIDEDDRPLLVGRYRNFDPQQQLAWFEVWLRRLDAAGDVQCAVDHRATSDGLIPPSIVAEGGATRSDGGAIVTGMHELGEDLSLWLGTFRPT
jgi:cysteine-rich repeat protein